MPSSTEMAMPAAPPRSTAMVLMVLVLGQVMISMDYSLASVAMPSIGRALDVGPDLTQWILSANALAFGGFLIIGGRLADVFGQKKCLIAGLACFTLGTLGSGLAAAIIPLIAARVLEGIGAAISFPAMLSLITLTFAEGPERFKAMTISTTAQFIGTPVGVIAAGWLIAQIGWRGAFFLNVPLGVICLLLAPGVIPSRPRASDAVREPIDFVGAALVTAGLALLIWSLSAVIVQGTSASSTVLSAFGGSLLILAVFVLMQRAATAPLVSGAVLRSPNLIGGVIIIGILVTGLAGLVALANISLQQGLDFTPMQAGQALLPYGLMSVLVSLMAPRLAPYLLPRPRASLIVALAVLGACHLLVSLAPAADTSLYYLMAALLLAPLGGILGLNIGIGEVLARVAPENQGIASALIYAVMQVMMAICVSAMITASNPAAAIGTRSLVAFAPSFQIAALICLFGMVVTFVMLRPRPAN